MHHEHRTARRNFLKKASIGGALALSIPQIVSAGMAAAGTGNEQPAGSARSRIKLKEGAVVLFQGDSITDAGRNKEEQSANNGSALGGGYAFLAACELLYRHAGKNLSIYNKGISGNKVFQLAERWDQDCIQIKPDVLSILIGVNDYWHKHNGNYDGTVQVYRDDYRALLDRTLKQLPNVQLIIGEPFAVNRVKAVDDSWYPEFDAYRAAAKEIATEFKAAFIPYQEIFNKAERSAPGSYWTPDGVHPSLAGANLMAHAWMETIEK
ncbi:MAG: SGNH/GDSL hydrolase family protein [Solitalea sp.]